MSRYIGELQKTKTIFNVLVPRHRQGKHFTTLHTFCSILLCSILTKFLCYLIRQVKKKMLYSSSFDALKKSLVGVQKYIQATDLSEASQDSVEEKLRATDRQ